jgi:Reverse transcriptase (RNA-dependent DNA polymerase)
MTKLQNFVRRGMLPKELPPNFTSETFARALRSVTPPPFATDKKWVSTTSHSLARLSGIRRVLSVPHPIGHYRISFEIASHWDRIRKHLLRSKWSRSLPTLKPRNQRAAGPKSTGEETIYEKASCRATARYLLRTDIVEFYRSVYTHSIPWALAGKDAAKLALQNKSPLWCDALDKTTQWGQSGQTNGIPCGPDTSFILGEILLSAIDFELQGKLPFVVGYRYYDDYELAVGTRGEAEQALNCLQDELATFNLQLNSTKTKIIDLPLVAEGSISWVKAFPARSSRFYSQDDLLEFYRRVFEHRQTDPSSQVVTFALSRMSEHHWRGLDWTLAQDLMSQAVISDTGAISIRTRFSKVTRETERCPRSRSAIQMPIADCHSSRPPWARQRGRVGVVGLHGF